MRLADASHVDLGSFYARLPGLGRVYRLFGYAACIGVLWYAHDISRVSSLLVVLIIAGLMAWKREVGALFRAPLVASIAMCAVLITADRLGHPLQSSTASSCPAPAPEPRRIEIHVHGDGSAQPMPAPMMETTK